jgi:hypothetical protein
MSDISEDQRDYLEEQLLGGAIELEAVKHGNELRQLYRQERRALESIPERELVVRRLKALDSEMGLLGDGDEAVQAARRRVADAHYKLASSRS